MPNRKGKMTFLPLIRIIGLLDHLLLVKPGLLVKVIFLGYNYLLQIECVVWLSSFGGDFSQYVNGSH